MIEFHNDRLVPPELCRILYQAVPKAWHVPVRFHNRRRKDLYGERGRYPLGSMYAKHNVESAYIDINLNPLYEASLWRSSSYTSAYTSAPSSFVWRKLLEVCLHEFGHVATHDLALKMNQHEYEAEYGLGKVYLATERLANEWRDLRVAKILKNNSRLGQPGHMTGYLGARLIRWKEGAKDIPGCFEYIAERRCSWTGAQLTAGDLLRQLGIEPRRYTNVYRILRRVSEGVGVDYVDRAGRHHKLYTWGDVPVLAQRLDELAWRLRERHNPQHQEVAERDFEDYFDIPF
jgi:hypothetical protein